MNGVVNLITHNGLLQSTDTNHTEAIGVLRCHHDRLIAGSHDSAISVFRSIDLVPISTLHAHYGNIRDIICIDVSLP